MLTIMVARLVDRKRRVNEVMSGKGRPASASGDTLVSDKALFAQLGNKLKVVKHGS